MSLKDKGLNNITSCLMCSRHNNDRLHLFFKCPSSCNIWSLWEAYPFICNLINQGHESTDTNFNILKILQVDDATLFCYIL